MPPVTHCALQGVCAWPNLTLLADGSIAACIFNQPCHGLWEGDLDCWTSEDQGQTWQFRGRPGPHEPGTNRMNCAVGLGLSGDLVVLVSGWSGRGPAGTKSGFEEHSPLTPWVCRSRDGGRTWDMATDFPASPSGAAYIPFGDILPAADASLCASAYCGGTAYLLRSRDDGASWGEPVAIGEGINETALLHLGERQWLAACRTAGDQHLQQFRSEDDGATWHYEMPLSLPMQHPGHLLRLSDGGILLTYGTRHKYNWGVDARRSNDEGRTWGRPVRLGSAEFFDSGYPSSVEVAPGRLVTAYYTIISGEYHYEMRVTTWDASEVPGA